MFYNNNNLDNEMTFDRLWKCVQYSFVYGMKSLHNKSATKLDLDHLFVDDTLMIPVV